MRLLRTQRAISSLKLMVVVLLGSVVLSGCGSLLTENVAKKDQVILVVPEQVLEAPGTWTTMEKRE